jgi:hypothetical protein
MISSASLMKTLYLQNYVLTLPTQHMTEQNLLTLALLISIYDSLSTAI